MTLTQQWQYLNLTRNGFCILLPAKGIVGYVTAHHITCLKARSQKTLHTGSYAQATKE